MVIGAMRVVLLAIRPIVGRTRPMSATIINLEVKKVPECDPTDILIRDRRIHIARNDPSLEFEGPFHVSVVLRPLIDPSGPGLRYDHRFTHGALDATFSLTRSNCVRHVIPIRGRS